MARILQLYAKRLLKLDAKHNKIVHPTLIDRQKLNREVRAIAKELKLIADSS